MDHATEKGIREFLWRYHGHERSLYGDDGEMQCSKCIPHWFDYRRAPLDEVLVVAAAAKFEQNVKAHALIEHDLTDTQDNICRSYYPRHHPNCMEYLR